jgi:hypothetical protein
MEEIIDLHSNEWIVLKVTELDDLHRALRGEVVGHSRSIKRMCKAWARARDADPEARLYVLFGGERHVYGDEARLLMAEAARGPYVNARW